MPQLSYTNAPEAAYEGQMADSGAKDIISKTADTDISFGLFVSLGSGDNNCKLPAASGDVGGTTFGVTIRAASREPNGDVGYLENDTVAILNKGRVWMRVEDAVTAGDDVYVRHTANGAGKDPGQVRSDADTAKAVQLTRAKFATSAGAGELVVVELS